MIHLLYSGNEAMLKGILSSTISIASKTKESLTVHILTGDFTSKDPKYTAFNNEQAEFIEKVLKFYDEASSVKLYNISNEVKKEIENGKNLHNRFSPYTLLRLFVNQEMLGGAKKVLYLDADTMAADDVSLLYNIDLRGNYVAMVPDAVGSIWLQPTYCNAGMILMDLEAISRTNIFALCRKMIQTKRLWMPDQTAINTYFDDKKLYLPRKFNEQKATQKDTVIRHFCDVMKLLPILHVVKVKQWEIEKVHNLLNDHTFDDVLLILEPLIDCFNKKEDPSAILFANYSKHAEAKELKK